MVAITPTTTAVVSRPSRIPSPHPMAGGSLNRASLFDVEIDNGAGPCEQ
jgi:hypothetical protein